MRQRALFPISLSNQRFSTQIVTPAIEEILDKYDEITFLVADRLQSYNRAIAVSAFHGDADRQASGADLFGQATRLTGTLQERRRWLDRVKLRLGEAALNITWRIESVDDVADAKSFAILRQVDILFGIDTSFRRDVVTAAHEFADRHPPHLREVATMLSIRYIIEELALSLRMRAQRRFYDEYYIGESLIPARRLYDGRYMASPWQLAGVKPTGQPFRFFALNPARSTGHHWRELGLAPGSMPPPSAGLSAASGAAP
jgi:hypothetical protein